MGAVETALRERWRHKAKWGTDILKISFKRKHKTTTGGMKGASALNQPQIQHHRHGFGI